MSKFRTSSIKDYKDYPCCPARCNDNTRASEVRSSPAAMASEHDAPQSTSTVAVLLCCFNGDRFLEEQLESIGRQQGARVSLHVSDDGSTDQTQHILEHFRARWGEERLTIAQGPRCGYIANFFSLLCSMIEADYFAYADQDDIWDSDKLARAIAALSALPEGQPGIYCSRTRLVSLRGKPLGLSPLFSKPPAFANALIQNIGGGNTMVLNRAARNLLRAVGLVDVVSHDWWTYILVTGSGGTVIYDPHPTLSYRQHQGNLIGSNTSWRDRLVSFSLALRGRKRAWNIKNLKVLQQHRALLTQDNQQVLDEYCKARDARLFSRVLGMWRSGVYAQSGMGNLALIVTTLLKKL